MIENVKSNIRKKYNVNYLNQHDTPELMKWRTDDGKYRIDDILNLARATPQVIIEENTRHLKYVLKYTGTLPQDEPALAPCVISERSHTRNLTTWFRRATRKDNEEIYAAFKRGSWE